MSFSTIEIPGEEAVARLMELRAEFPSTGHYPFLIGDAEEFSRLDETARFDSRSPAEIIEASMQVDMDSWMKHRRLEAEEAELSMAEILGEWPGTITEKGSICLHLDLLSGKPKPSILLGTVATDQPWKLPAYLKYGNWNECPPPEIQCAFHRRWQALYGSQITGMSSDIVECIVLNPPLEPETAIELAWEQFWYCGDIVSQGTATIQNLAATLLESPYWYFWWD